MRAAGKISAVLLSVAALLLAGCDKTYPDGLSEHDVQTRKYVNSFAREVMDFYYLWNAEVRDGINSWRPADEPFSKIESLRYKDSDGNPVDRWTKLIDDYESFIGSVRGVGTTLGLDFELFWTDATKTKIAMVISFVYAGSPAEKAGFGRGDAILKINGTELTAENYIDLINSTIYGGIECSIEVVDGRVITISPVEMYCDPVVCHKIFEEGSRKIGYLFFASYTLDSIERLTEVFSEFKAAGVEELILDLRYNGGGYDITSKALCSMVAPRSALLESKIYLREIYNEELGKVFGEGAASYFTDQYLEFNIDAKKVYAITTKSSASASEATICALRPYVDVVTVGKRSYGKYCSGMVFKANDWYESYKTAISKSDYQNGLKYADNWGLYVMTSRYADCNGETGCMPDGYAADIDADDTPSEGFQIGDPRESMLRRTLQTAGFSVPALTQTKTEKKPVAIERPASIERNAFGIYLK